MDLNNLSNFFAKITGQNSLSWIKAGVAIVACLFLYYEAQALAKSIAPRTKQIVGGILAIAAITCYFLFFHLSYKGYYHRWEFFHYYMGSKYATELSYEKIYVCSAIADSETGNAKAVKRRKMRDLRVDNLVPSSEALANPAACKDAFTPEKWEAFKSDLIWFRQVSGPGYWNDMQKDHGYNPPPVWTIAGHYISWLAPAGDSFFKLLAGIDVAFSAGMFVLIAWAFGWRAMVVSAIFWGTQEPAPFYWTGGAFLRQDWMFMAVLSAALIRKKHYFWAGAALAYAALLRVFPVLLFAGPLVVIASDIIRNRRLQPKYMKLLGGAALAGAILIPWSVHVAGVPAYKEFFHHIHVHNNTPLTNHMGLKTVIATSPENRMKYTRDNRLLDPFERWKDARRARYQHLKFVYYGIVALFVAGLTWACWRIKSIWVAMSLSLILVVSMVEATCYYYSVWIFAGILTKARRSMEIAVIGLAGLGQLLSTQFYFIDDKFTALSALYIAFTIAMVVSFMRKPEALLGAEAVPVRTSS
jgi:hypothetical protein